MKYFQALTIILIAFASCKDEKQIDEEFLNGKWIVIEASRNAKKTNTLDGAFFFFEHSILTTNFQGVVNQAEYQLTNNELRLTKGMNNTFQLYKTPDQKLVLTSKIQNSVFEFTLKKE